MIQIIRVNLPLRAPFETARGTTTHRQAVVVRHQVEGLVGWGEASPLPGLMPESADDAFAELLPLHGAPGVLLEDLGEVQQFVQSRVASVSAQHALSTALIDVMARARDIPLAQMLNPTVRRDVPISHLYQDEGRLFHATMLGAQTIKVKVGMRSLDAELGTIRAIREIVGPSVHIRLDANGAWTEEEAKAAIDAFVPIGVREIEDPINPYDFAGMARLRGRGIDIAADEGLASVDALASIIDSRAADVAVFKPMRLGSIVTCMGMMNMASNAGLEGFMTTTIDAAIGRMTALHLAAASPVKKLRACGLDTADWLAEDVGETPEMTGSHVDAPSRPGLGLDAQV